eukprot:g9969.t1
MSAGVSASSRVWGSVDGREVHRIDLDTAEGFGVSFATYGATLLSVRAADKDGRIEEVTLQHDTLEGVVADEFYYGSTVGRVCNRIYGAVFSVDGKSFSLEANNETHCLHGGPKGLDKAVWRHEIVGDGVRFEYDSPDGEGGFPGALAVKVTYSIKPGAKPGLGEMLTEMEAKHAPKGGGGKTPINLTNHAYWNLSGDHKRSVRGHSLKMRCDRYLHMDEKRLLTGEVAPVLGTFLDFSSEKSLGAAIDGMDGDPPGLDHCLVCVGASDEGLAESGQDFANLPLVARLSEADSGRVMELFASQPSAQVYTANYLSTDPANKPHAQHYAVCLEHQHFPDAVNRPKWAGSTLLEPGGTYLERARHVFSVVG